MTQASKGLYIAREIYDFSPRYMSQGSQLVPFQMNSAADPITPFCSTLQQDSALLQVNKHCHHFIKVSKGAKIRNQYNQVPHLTKDINGKVTNSQLYITNQSQEVSPFPAGDHKALINIRPQRHNKHKTDKS